jgi:hypothetical protein
MNQNYLTEKEFLELIAEVPSSPIIEISDFEDQTERTLLYGYTLERETVHVYMKNGLIHKVVYTPSRMVDATVVSIESKKEWYAQDLVPSEKAYPESTDSEFASLMLELRLDRAISFASYSKKDCDRRALKKFAGGIIEELN